MLTVTKHKGEHAHFNLRTCVPSTTFNYQSFSKHDNNEWTSDGFEKQLSPMSLWWYNFSPWCWAICSGV